MLNNTKGGWPLKPLSEVVDFNPRLNKAAYRDDLEVSFVPMAAVDAGNGRIDVSQTKSFSKVKKGYTPFQENDVLFAKITPCMENGKMAVVPKLSNSLGFGSTEFHVLRPREGINSRYIYYFVSSQSFRREAAHRMTGAVGQKRVPLPFLEETLIPVPVEDAQKLIVAEIEKQFSRLDEAVANLKRIKANLKRYKSAVLKAAVEGKLTEEWRKAHPDVEPASKLLERIIAEKRAKWERAEFAKMKAIGKIVEDKKWKKKFNEFPGVSSDELEQLPSLPTHWVYIRLGELLEDEPKYGTSKKCDYKNDGIGVLRIPNVVNGFVDVTDLKFAKFEKEELVTYSLKEGDILTIRSNGSVSLVGKCALVAKQDDKYLYAGYLIKIRPLKQLVLSTYLMICFSSILLRKQVEAKAKSTSGVNNINSGELQSLIFPLCNKEEQNVIVNEVERRLSVIVDLEATVEANLTRANSLHQSILCQAFRGQLQT